jgi:hypothetical protein
MGWAHTRIRIHVVKPLCVGPGGISPTKMNPLKRVRLLKDGHGSMRAASEEDLVHAYSGCIRIYSREILSSV